MIDTQTQIDRRRERAATDIARVVNRGGHVAFSTFDVTSTTDRTYRVQIRSLTELQNSCTCPDYQTNLIGTCKHIEGVLLNLKEALGEQWDELAAQAPPVTQIYLHHAEETTVRALPAEPVPPEIQALLDRYFDADGVLPGPVLKTLPALLAETEALPPRAQRHLFVADDVRGHLDRLQDLDAIRRQKEWFLEQVEQGSRSLSLLSTRLYPYQEQGAHAPGLWRAGHAGRRHGPGQNGAGHRRLLAAAPTARHPEGADRLPRLAQAPVGARNRTLYLLPGGRDRRRGPGPPQAVPRSRLFQNRQLRNRPARRGRNAAHEARRHHPRRGAAHQKLADQDRRRRQAPAQPLRLCADRHAPRKPPRRAVQRLPVPRPDHPRAAVAL